jgi:hypothetical protein
VKAVGDERVFGSVELFDDGQPAAIQRLGRFRAVSNGARLLSRTATLECSDP